MPDSALTLSELFLRIDILEKELVTLKESAKLLKSDSPPNKEIKSEPSKEQTGISSTSTGNPPQKKSSFINWVGFLGENLFIKLGLLTMLLGAIWFLNLAFEQYWINESVRIWLGLLSGIILVIGGMRLIQKWPLIGPSLIGSGISLSFASYFLGYFIYDLYSLNSAFVGLFLLCLLTIGLSYFLESEVVFGFGILGAFLTPTLLSTGENSYKFLFLYLLFWNLAFLLISRKTKWRITPLLLLAGNHIFFTAWGYEKLEVSRWQVPLLFQISIFLIFLVREHLIVPRATNKEKILSTFTVGLALLFVYLQGYWLSFLFFPEFQKGLLLGFVVVHYGFLLRSLPNTKPGNMLVDTFHGGLGLIGSLFLLSSLVIGFEGRPLSFVSLSFATLLSVAGARSKFISLYTLALLFWFTGLVNLFAGRNWMGNEEYFLFNGRFFLYLLSSILLFLIYRMGKDFLPISNIYKWISFPILLLGSWLDVYYNIPSHYQLLGYSAFLAIYGLGFTSIGFMRTDMDLRRIGLVCLVLVILKLYLYDFWNMGLMARIFAGFGLGASLVLTGIIYNRSKKNLLDKKESP